MTGGNVLMLGGTRYFGRQIVCELLDRGYDVTIVTRGNRPAPIKHTRLRVLACDRKDWPAMSRLLEGERFDAAIDNICYAQEDAEAAIALLKGRCGLYVFSSSILAYLDACLSERPLAEKILYERRTTAGMETRFTEHERNYGKAKRDCEVFLHSVSGLRCVAFRMPNIVGPDDFSGKSSALPLALMAGVPIRLPGRPEDTIQQVFIGDVARVYADAVDRRNGTLAPAYNVALPPVTMVRYVDLVAGALGIEAVVAYAGRIQTGAPPKDETFDLPFPMNTTLDLAQLERDFGPLETPYEVFVPETARWYAERAERAAVAAGR